MGKSARPWNTLPGAEIRRSPPVTTRTPLIDCCRIPGCPLSYRDSGLQRREPNSEEAVIRRLAGRTQARHYTKADATVAGGHVQAERTTHAGRQVGAANPRLVSCAREGTAEQGIERVTTTAAVKKPYYQKPRPETLSAGLSLGSMGDEGLEPPTSRM